MSSVATDTKTRILEATWQLLEERQGQGVRMNDIAKVAGLSRQAVYLHFASRTELIVATIHYVDEVKGLNERLDQFRAARTGIELLEACIDVWCHYIPEIYGLVKVMLATRDTDKAMAAAWNSSMGCLRELCQEAVIILDREGSMSPEWSRKEAIDLFYTMISVQNWEQLTSECGWSTEQYIAMMKRLLIGALVAPANTEQ